LRRDSLALREGVLDFLRENPELESITEPSFSTPELRVVASALLELMAQRWGQRAPAWTRAVGSLSEPFFLLESALTMPRLRALCERESPLPLRKRGLYAPPNFLQFA
jgi:hypothetical protein